MFGKTLPTSDATFSCSLSTGVVTIMAGMIMGLSRAVSHDGRSTEGRGVGIAASGTVELGLDSPRPDRPRHPVTPGLRFAPHPVADRRGGLRPKRHVRDVLRLLHLLTLAILTIVGAGIASPARGTTTLAGPVAVAPGDSVHAAKRALAPQPSHQRRHHVTHPAADLDALEADLDDDRDVLPDAAADRTATFTGVWLPRRPSRGLRVDPQTDTSRFASGTGLPRGPPT